MLKLIKKIEDGFESLTILLKSKADKSALAPYLDDDNKEQLLNINKVCDVGWHTIAYLPSSAIAAGQRAYASFVIAETNNGQHQTLHFDAAHTYGNGNVINLVGMSSYDKPSNVISKIRVIAQGTYDGAILQIYVATTSKIKSIKMYNNLQNLGWMLCIPTLNTSTEHTAIVSNFPAYAQLTTKAEVLVNSRYIGTATSNDAYAENFNMQGGALISSRHPDDSTSNVDHIHHNDSSNTWYFVSDSTYKTTNATGNIKAMNVGCQSIQVGESSPKIAFKKLTGTYSTTANGSKKIAHGENGSKILSVNVTVNNNDIWSHIGSKFDVSHDATNIIIKGLSDNDLLSKTLKILIIYEF